MGSPFLLHSAAVSYTSPFPASPENNLSEPWYCALQLSPSPPLIPHREVSGASSCTGGGRQDKPRAGPFPSLTVWEEFAGRKPLRPSERLGLGLCRKAASFPLPSHGNFEFSPEVFPRCCWRRLRCLPPRIFCENRVLCAKGTIGGCGLASLPSSTPSVITLPEALLSLLLESGIGRPRSFLPPSGGPYLEPWYPAFLAVI